MTPAGDTMTKIPTGYIRCNGRPMAYWLPRGVTVDVVEIIADSHPSADDSVNDLVDDAPGAGG